MTQKLIDEAAMQGWFPMDIAHARRIMDKAAPDQIIGRGNDPYMERWFLRRKGDGPLENAYIHHFVRSDREDVHDHPWANISVVLAGSYVEETPSGVFLRKAGDIVAREADAVHRIVSTEPGTVTMFLTGRKERDWGFYVEEGAIVPETLYSAYLATMPEMRRRFLSDAGVTMDRSDVSMNIRNKAPLTPL